MLLQINTLQLNIVLVEQVVVLLNAVHVLRALNVQFGTPFYLVSDLYFELRNDAIQLLLLLAQLQDVLIVGGYLEGLATEVIEQPHRRQAGVNLR